MFKAVSHRQLWQLWVYTISANQTLEPQCRQLENKDHTMTCVYIVRCRSVRAIWARNEWFGYKKQHSCANTTFWLNYSALRSRIFQACCIILLLSSQDLLTPSHGLLPHLLYTWHLLQQVILEGLMTMTRRAFRNCTVLTYSLRCVLPLPWMKQCSVEKNSM